MFCSFLILPALLGYFTERQIGVLKRVENLQRARTYYMDFLRLCACYSFYDFEKLSKLAEVANADTDSSNGGASNSAAAAAAAANAQRSLQAAMGDRNAKIKRFRDEQELKRKLVELEQQLSAFADDRDADEELLRETYTTLVRRWIFVAEEALRTIHDELPLAKMISAERMSQNESRRHNYPATSSRGLSNANTDSGSNSNSNANRTPRMRPFILTKTKLQQEVYGLGYPSVPVMSIEEFAEQNAAMQPLVRAADEQARDDRLNRTILRPAEGSDSHAHGASSSTGSEKPVRVIRSDEIRAEQTDRAEQEAIERERAIEHDDEAYLSQTRRWDAYKDDHRVGEGNTYRIG